MRAIFDTNVGVSALIFGCRLLWLRHAWADGTVTPIVCRETVAEFLRVLGYPKFRLNTAERETLLGDYLPFAEVVQLPNPKPDLPVGCRDRDDVIFLHPAIASRAVLHRFYLPASCGKCDAGEPPQHAHCDGFSA